MGPKEFKGLMNYLTRPSDDKKRQKGYFETNDPKEAVREVIRRVVPIDQYTFPITNSLNLGLGPDLNQVNIGSELDVGGGTLSVGGGIKGDEKAFGIGFRKEFDAGGVAQIKSYVESLPKNTVVTRKLIKDFIDSNKVNVNFDNLFNKQRPSYVGNFIEDKSITVDPSYAASVGDTKRFKKSKDIINDPKKLKEFLKYGNKKGISIDDIRKKYNIGAEEFYEGGLRQLFDKNFSAQRGLNNKTINNIQILLNDSEAFNFLKKGQIVPENVLTKLNMNPSAAATATIRIGQIFDGKDFGVDAFKKIRKNTKASTALFNNMNKFTFGNPYRSKLYKTSLELIDDQLGNEKGTFESLKGKARQILKKNKIKGFDINEIAGVTGSAKTGAGEFSQFIDVLDSNLNQKQGAAFQSAFSNARQKIANNPDLFQTEAKKINKLASNFESQYGFKLPRIRKLEDVEKYYSPKRLSDLTKQGIDIKKASEKLGYTIQMPRGAVTAKEFVEKPGLKEKFLKGIGTGAKAVGKVIKPVGYAIGTAAAYQAKSMADEMGIDLKPQDYFMAVDSGDPEVAINNAKRRIDPEFAAQERAKDLARMSDDFEEVGQQPMNIDLTMPKFSKGGRASFESGTIPGGYTDDAYKYLREMDDEIFNSYKKYRAGGGKMKYGPFAYNAKRMMFGAFGVGQKKFAEGGGVKSGPPPESGPTPHGLPSLMKRGMKI